MIHIQLYGQKSRHILATIMVPHRTQLMAEVVSNPCRNQAMPFPLTPFDSMYRLSNCTSEDGPPSSNAFSHYCPTSDPLRFQRSNAFPNAPPTAKHFPRFSQRFRPFSQFSILHSFSRLFHGFIQFVRRFNLFFHCFVQFRWVCSILQLYYRSVFNAYEMHLPQSAPLHRLNRFAPFFHGFISVLPLHSRHTSKSQFFHCFSIVSRALYAIMVPHRSLNFSIVFSCHQFLSFYFIWHHFGPTSQAQFFHCFSIF